MYKFQRHLKLKKIKLRKARLCMGTKLLAKPEDSRLCFTKVLTAAGVIDDTILSDLVIYSL